MTVHLPQKQWQVDIYTANKQELLQTFYGETLVTLRERVFSWMQTTSPTYLRSGRSQLVKHGKIWEAISTKLTLILP